MQICRYFFDEIVLLKQFVRFRMKKILILGGGFAGIYTAKNLQKQNLEGYEMN